VPDLYALSEEHVALRDAACGARPAGVRRLVSGWLGGILVYRFGVRVADKVTQAEVYR
jgi:hypothetical protein